MYRYLGGIIVGDFLIFSLPVRLTMTIKEDRSMAFFSIQVIVTQTPSIGTCI